MLKKILFPLIAVLLFTACSPRMNTGFSSDEMLYDIYVGATDSLFNLELLYIAATDDYLIFETTFINLSEEPIELKRENFLLKQGALLSSVHPYTTDDLMEFLMLERKQTKKLKRQRTALTGVGIAFGILTGVVGGFGTQSVIYGLEDLIYLSGDRRGFERDISSIEDEMDYLQKMNLESVNVMPGDTIVREIFFPFTSSTENSEITFLKNGNEHLMILTPEDLRQW